MRLKSISILIITLMLVSLVPTSLEIAGKFSSGTGCGCHYGGSATASMTGQPSSYTPGSTYTLSISVSGGVSGSAGGFSLDVNKGTLSTGGVGIMAVKVNSAQNSATPLAVTGVGVSIGQHPHRIWNSSVQPRWNDS